MLSGILSKSSKVNYSERRPDGISLIDAIERCDAIIIGAGAGMSAAAGFVYSGDRFRRYFADFERRYGFHDMYSGGFYPYGTMEEHWAYWSRYIYVNRFMDPPGDAYSRLYELVRDKDYFVLTTNVDHCFQKAGFDRERLFYTQGDYGLFQCSRPCCQYTFDNEEAVREMLTAQGFHFAADGTLLVPQDGALRMRIPGDLVPRCPVCGRPMSMNLRADDTFVEDEGWHEAAGRYSQFLKAHEGMRVLYLELGVGYNTPVIIKYPFWRMTMQNPLAEYICINHGEAFCPEEIDRQSICIDGDIGRVLEQLAAG